MNNLQWFVPQKRCLVMRGSTAALLCAVPLTDVRLTVFDLSVSCLSFFMIAFIIIGVLSFTAKNLQALVSSHKIFAMLVTLFLICYAVAAITTGTTHAWGVFIEWFVLPLCTGVIVALSIVRDREGSLNGVLWGIIGLLCGIVASCAVYYIYNVQTWDGRFFGLWGSPNHLALILAPVVAFAAIAWVVVKKSLGSALVLCGGLALPFLVMTKSLGGLVALTLSLVMCGMVYCAHSTKQRTKFIFGAIVLVVAITVSIAAFEKFGDSYGDLSRSPLASRLVIWNVATDLIRTNSLGGIGIGKFQQEYTNAQQYYSPYLEWSAPLPHNLMMTMWLYGGFGGMTLFLLILAYTARSMTRTHHTNLKTALPFIGVLLVITMHGFVDTTYWKGELSLFFWISCLSAIAILKKEEKQR